MEYAFTTDTLLTSLQGMWFNLGAFLPKLIFALIFIAIGFLVGWLAKHAIEELFKVLKIDRLLSHTGLDEAMERSGYKLNSGLLVGEIVRWFFVVVFLIFSFDMLGLEKINEFLGSIATGFIPNIFVAVLIILAGAILGQFIDKVITGGVKMVGHKRSSKVLGKIAHWAIVVFAVIIALDQIGIAEFYLRTFYQAVVFMVALGGALAFGLGGKEYAARFLHHAKTAIKADSEDKK